MGKGDKEQERRKIWRKGERRKGDRENEGNMER